MLMFKKLLLFFIVLLCYSSFSRADESESGKLCGDKRLTPVNYVFQFGKHKRALKKIKVNSFTEKMHIYFASNQIQSEVCAWNKFLLVDFIIYFSQFKKIDIKSPNMIKALKMRDALYEKWLTYNKERPYKGRFGLIKKVSRALNRKPKKNKAKRFVHETLSASSPFNSIMQKKAIELLFDPQITEELRCFLNEVKTMEHKFLTCTDNVMRSFEILGALSSQRMYLIRDLAAEFKEDKTEEEYAIFYENSALSSLLYFKLETFGHMYGVKSLFPTDQYDFKSFKPYHFYSVAFIAYTMKVAGYDEKEIRRYAGFYARKYKTSIKLVGLLYNTLLGLPLKNGSVGDAKQIKKEQGYAIDYVLEMTK
jgi:hypothetical protein